MAKDKKDPEDNVPDEELSTDELTTRRAAREDAFDAGGEDRSIADMAEGGEEEDGQMFVWEQGRRVTLGTLIGRAIPVEHAFVFGGKRLKGSGNLISFDDDVLVVVRGRVGKTSLVPTRDDQERVTKVTVEVHIASNVVAPADSGAGMSLLAGVFEKRGIKAA